MNYRRWMIGVVALLWLATFGASAAPYRQIDFNGAAHPGLKRIALFSIDEPRKFAIEGRGVNPLLLFGALGGAIAEAELDPYAKALADRKIRIGASLVAALKLELQSRGYEVIEVPSPPVSVSDALKKETLAPVASADAMLIVTLPVNGFKLSSSKDAYEPLLVVSARLIAAERSEPLYNKGYTVGLQPKSGDGGGRFLQSDARYAGDAQSIVTMAEETSGGIIAAHKQIAARIAADLAPSRAYAESPPRTSMRVVAPPAVTPPSEGRDVVQEGTTYIGSMRCGAYEGTGRVEFPGAWVAPARMMIRGGQATMERGDGKYSESLSGRVDGSMMGLRGRGAMNATPNAYWVTHVWGQFSGTQDRFDGTAEIADSKGQIFRRCSVDLVRH